LAPISIERGQLYCQIANRGAFHGPEQNLQAASFGGQEIEIAILAAPAHHKKTTQFFAGDFPDRGQHSRVARGETMKNAIRDFGDCRLAFAELIMA